MDKSKVSSKPSVKTMKFGSSPRIFNTYSYKDGPEPGPGSYNMPSDFNDGPISPIAQRKKNSKMTRSMNDSNFKSEKDPNTSL